MSHTVLVGAGLVSFFFLLAGCRGGTRARAIECVRAWTTDNSVGFGWVGWRVCGVQPRRDCLLSLSRFSLKWPLVGLVEQRD